MNALLKGKRYFNKRLFLISLIISVLLNFTILIFFSYISKIANIPKPKEEPKIRFVEIDKREKLKIEERKVKNSKVDKKNRLNLEKKQQIYKELKSPPLKPAQTEKGKEIKKSIVLNKPKNVIPAKENNIKPKKEVKVEKIPVSKEKVSKKTSSKTPNIIKEEKVVERKLPPPPKKIDLEDNYSLSPPEAPDIVGDKEILSDLSNIEGIKEENPTELLKGIKTITPVRKKIQFGQKFNDYDENVEGTAKSRKIVYMPPPPTIKTKVVIPPKSVKVKIWISPDGRVVNVLLLKKTGNPEIDKAIIEYVKSWKFDEIDTDEIQWATTTIRFNIK